MHSNSGGCRSGPPPPSISILIFSIARQHCHSYYDIPIPRRSILSATGVVEKRQALPTTDEIFPDDMNTEAQRGFATEAPSETRLFPALTIPRTAEQIFFIKNIAAA